MRLYSNRWKSTVALSGLLFFEMAMRQVRSVGGVPRFVNKTYGVPQLPETPSRDAIEYCLLGVVIDKSSSLVLA
jgi:hypothetical protein